MRIVSLTAVVPASPKDVAHYIQDLRNLHDLLPLDQISDWESTSESCSFKIKGGITISLNYQSTEEFSRILLSSGKSSPFPFTLTVHMKPYEENLCEGHMEFDAKVSPLVRLIAEKPLTNLFNTMTDKLRAHFTV